MLHDTEIIKSAVISQIYVKAKVNAVGTTILNRLVKQTLGVKITKGKRIPHSVTALKEGLKSKLEVLLFSKMGLKEMKQLIKGEMDEELLSIVHSIPLTHEEHATEEVLKEETRNLLGAAPVDKLWEILEKVGKFSYEDELKKAQEKAAKVKAKKDKVAGYTSVPDEVAAPIIASYYTQLASDASICTPECFRGGRTSNPTNALRRLELSHVMKEVCDTHNSMATSAYDWYKSNASDMTLEKANEIINGYLTSNPDRKEQMKMWINEPYMKAVIKK